MLYITGSWSFGGIRAGLTIGIGFLKTEKGIAHATSTVEKVRVWVKHVDFFIR